MTQRVSKLDAARLLEVSPTTIDRRIQRGELQVEMEPRGTRFRTGLSWAMVCHQGGHQTPQVNSQVIGQMSAPRSSQVNGHRSSQPWTLGSCRKDCTA